MEVLLGVLAGIPIGILLGLICLFISIKIGKFFKSSKADMLHRFESAFVGVLEEFEEGIGDKVSFIEIIRSENGEDITVNVTFNGKGSE